MIISSELIRSALTYIPADLARDDWARIGMAIKSEFPDGDGLALFDEWSATAEGYRSHDVRATWRSIKQGGGVGIGTLLHEAKARGFAPPSDPLEGDPQARLVDTARRTRKLAERVAEEATRQASYEAAAMEASALWGKAFEGPYAYLDRKAVRAHGLRVGADDSLLVPLRDESGKLWNVQRIAASKPERGPDKLYLKGGRRSGLWHRLGEMDSASAVLVAEGYATAATLDEATARPAVVAFDAGNLLQVVKALRLLLPEAAIIVCGDDDKATEASTGKNPGRLKAQAAAEAVDGVAVFPIDLPEGGSDFNDLCLHAGTEVVRQIVEAAIPAIEAKQARPSRGDTKRSANAASESSSTRGAASEPDAVLDVFSVDDRGVWFVGIEQDGKRRPPEWVCSRPDVAALTRDQEGAGWGYLFQFADALGHHKQWAMPVRMLSGDGGKYRAFLLNMGLRIAASPRARNLLAQYIQSRTPGAFAQCTDRIGWHDHAFVLPRESIGDEAERIVFQSDSQMENTFKARGSVEQWRERVGKFCAGNSRLVFAVSCAFAGPLLRPGGVESRGFHLRGDSSSGKTTALKLAASVYGGPNYLQRATVCPLLERSQVIDGSEARTPIA
ncbi:DUF927 domain-containing protein [Variovorax paradoxus]|uniref:DUF927 domain-containing protein n=1 Tax=Variovorax paradoxus TaxID=34073 RepID=UPI003D65C69F